MKVTDKGFLCCPACGEKTKTKVVPGTTELTRFPLYCPWCKREYMIDYKKQARA